MSSELSFIRQNLKVVINIYAVNKKRISCRKRGFSRTKIAFLFKCSYFSYLLLHFAQKAKFPCSKKVGALLRRLFLFCLFVRGRGGGDSMHRSQNLEIVVFSVKKQLHNALGSVQFLASFTSFDFKILSYFACGEKIIRLASKNSVKLDPKSASDL